MLVPRLFGKIAGKSGDVPRKLKHLIFIHKHPWNTSRNYPFKGQKFVEHTTFGGILGYLSV